MPGRVVKMDERRLLGVMLYNNRKPGLLGTTWQLAEDLGIPYKRARYIVRDKWGGRCWVEWGVSWRCAWLEPAGVEVAESMRLCVCGWEGMAEDMVDGPVAEAGPYCCPECGCTARGPSWRGTVESQRELIDAKREHEAAMSRLDQLLEDLTDRFRPEDEERLPVPRILTPDELARRRRR